MLSAVAVRSRFLHVLPRMSPERLKRLGAIGFLFFLLKGLAWLLLPLAWYAWATS